ncbi:MAG: hypothetical protein OXL37_17100 [Chloroflexota bacterium]|nr:hypothetical protein [Chloroflexota bacterium]MDE2960427.1 hypothetical protein [Chloroflexota bacterium]
MAGETPHNTPFDAGSPDTSAQATDSGEQERLQSVWRTNWQSVALSWFGGLLFGSMFLSIAFTLEDATRIAGVAAGGVFLMIAPGSYATWDTWRGHRYSIGKGRRKSRAGESQNAG